MAESGVKAISDDTSLLADISAESSAALDALFKENGVDVDTVDKTPPPPAPGTPDPAKVEADRLAAEKAAADKAAADVKPKSDIVQSLDDTATKDEADRKAAADKLAADEAAAKAAKEATPADPWDSVELPSNAKSKSGEAFATVKRLAKEATTDLKTRLAAAEAARAESEAKAAEALQRAEEAAAKALPDEVEKELADLRRFRISKDAASDPRLKTFDAAIAKNTESIYRKLTDILPAESIKQIKELGGPEAVDWDPILPKLPLPTRRFIEATLVDNARQAELKADALAAAVEDGARYASERAQLEATELTESANAIIKDLPWTKEKPVPATATPEQKAAIEADNAFAKQSLAKLKDFLSDRSPARVAELAVGTLIAYRNKADLLAVQQKLSTADAEKAAAVKDLMDKVTALTKEKDKLTADLNAIRRAELPRGQGAHNIVSDKPVTGGFDNTGSGGDALDALAAQIAAAQSE